MTSGRKGDGFDSLRTLIERRKKTGGFGEREKKGGYLRVVGSEKQNNTYFQRGCQTYHHARSSAVRHGKAHPPQRNELKEKRRNGSKERPIRGRVNWKKGKETIPGNPLSTEEE